MQYNIFNNLNQSWNCMELLGRLAQTWNWGWNWLTLAWHAASHLEKCSAAKWALSDTAPLRRLRGWVTVETIKSGFTLSASICFKSIYVLYCISYLAKHDQLLFWQSFPPLLQSLARFSVVFMTVQLISGAAVSSCTSGVPSDIDLVGLVTERIASAVHSHGQPATTVPRCFWAVCCPSMGKMRRRLGFGKIWQDAAIGLLPSESVES